MAKPNLSYLKNLILTILGIPCGVMVGVTGLSCAPILQPALRWLIGINGPTLNGVVLVMISFTAWSSLVSFGQAGDVQWLFGAFLTLGTFTGAAFGTRIIGKNPIFFLRIRPLWAFIPIACALLMIAESTGLIYRPVPAHPLLPGASDVLQPIWCLVIGTAIGFIGLAGELGSSLAIPSLLFLLGRSIGQSEGTALFILVLASLPTALIHAVRKTLNGNAAMALSFGGLFGALFGSHLAVKELHDTTLIFLSGLALAVYSLTSLFQRPPKLKDIDPDTN